MIATQERILKESQEAYDQSRQATAGTPFYVRPQCRLVNKLYLSAQGEDGEDLLMPNPNHQINESESEEESDEEE